MLTLRAASITEAEALTELCLRSKAVWGYDRKFMEACRAELTITPEKICESSFQVAEADEKLVGVAQVSFKGDGLAELEALFVDPKAQRLGVGRALFDWAISICREQGVSIVIIGSDPGAASFYRRMGAEDIGQAASESMPGRMIPRLHFKIA